MIQLEELVAAVLNEFAIAHTKATLFSAQMAADFREHELLRQLPIPTYTIRGAEVCLPFAIASGLGGDRRLASAPIEPSQLEVAAKAVTADLPEQEALKQGLLLDPDQKTLWRESAPAIAERFAAGAVQALSIDVLSAIYGYLVTQRYLVSLVERSTEITETQIREILKTGYPDTLREAASQLMKRELEKRLIGRAEEDHQEAVEERGKRDRKPLALYIEVEPKRLKDIEHVSTLRLHLQEGTLEGMTFSEGEEVGDEKRQASREDT